MTGSEPDSGDIFDVRNFRRLVELMKEHDLSEVDLRRADERIRLRRGGELVVATHSVAPPLPAPAAQAPPKPSEGKPAEEKGLVIKSPMVGTFYASSSPESPPFVKVGDRVGADTTVCIIEAMKVFNEIPAECTGKITAILVENGDPVEYGQALYRVDPNG